MRRQLMSPVYTAANYIKVHAFLARGTCLFSLSLSLAPCSFLFVVPSFASSSPCSFPLFLSPAFLSFLSARFFHISFLPPVSFARLARVISPVEHHIRPWLRARSFGSCQAEYYHDASLSSEREIPYRHLRSAHVLFRDGRNRVSCEPTFSREFSRAAAIRYSTLRPCKARFQLLRGFYTPGAAKRASFGVQAALTAPVCTSICVQVELIKLNEKVLYRFVTTT